MTTYDPNTVFAAAGGWVIVTDVPGGVGLMTAKETGSPGPVVMTPEEVAALIDALRPHAA
jgi:hypothetical protein